MIMNKHDINLVYYIKRYTLNYDIANNYIIKINDK